MVNERQEALKIGLAQAIRRALGPGRFKVGTVESILTYLDSQGLVFKVESNRPPRLLARLTDEANWANLVKDGWSKTERII